MIPQRLKICSDCKQKKQIFSHGRCTYCSKIHSMRSNTPQPPIYSRSGLRGTRGPLGGQSPRMGLKRTKIKPRSDKRIEQEKKYNKIKGELVKVKGPCFFCGEPVKQPDIHHLKGRDGDLIYNERYLVRVHRKCHSEYHDDSVEDISWFTSFLLRLREVDRALYEKELNKYDK